MHIEDLAAGHLAALAYLEHNPGFTAFNLGNGSGYSVMELLRTFEEVNELTIPYKIAERRPGDIAISYADPSKANHLLGWQAKYDLAAMCRDAWRWQQQNPLGYV